LELFLEHPPLMIGPPEEPWLIHLTDLRTFTPVSDGVVVLRLTDPQGSVHVERAEAPTSPGVYTVSPSFATAGVHDLVIELGGRQLSDEIFVGPVLVEESLKQADHSEDEHVTGITFLKEQQWSTAFRTQAATSGTVPASIGATGRVIATAGRLVEVVAPTDGLVLAADNRSAPVPGQWVREGDTLAVLAPVSSDQAYALQVAREQRLARDLERAERLYELEAIPARRLEDARRDLAVARAELSAMGMSAEGGGYELCLSAPISGVIDHRSLTLGQRVTAGDLLYTVVDPRRVWLRMDVSAHHAPQLSDASGATFSVEGNDRVYASSRVVSIGRVIDGDTRTIPVITEVDNSDQSLRIGMLAEGVLLLGDPEAGVVVPAAAVREEDGLFVAYVQTSGETFERRVLTVGPSDGVSTIVHGGVNAGERVVTAGAYQVKLATLNTADLAAHGHQH
jgi:RND family efflux transporter MFP subunit